MEKIILEKQGRILIPKKIRDKLTVKAKKNNYRARSVYKLFELNKKYNIIKKNDKVLDLGCYPGSWLQAVKTFGASAIGVDKKEIAPIEDVKFILGNIYDEKTIKEIIRFGDYDVVISDLAPSTTGIIDVDQEKSFILTKRALEIAREVLKENGNFLCKVFQSERINELVNEMKKQFRFVKVNKPSASKKRSKEVYIVALGFK